MESLSRWHLSILWSVIVGTAASCFWVFNNIAWASDVARIEIRLIKQDIREIRKEIALHTEDEATLRYLEEELEELIDELCQVSPEDREC